MMPEEDIDKPQYWNHQLHLLVISMEVELDKYSKTDTAVDKVIATRAELIVKIKRISEGFSLCLLDRNAARAKLERIINKYNLKSDEE